MRCIKCVNSINNPSKVFDNEGLCNVCNEYKNTFNPDVLVYELEFLKSFISKDGSIDCIAAISGGKDSMAMLKNICDFGFHPLAFTFEMGYNPLETTKKLAIERAITILNIQHQYIDGKKFLNISDKESFKLTAELYDDLIENLDRDILLNMFKEERYCNSPKNNDIRAFVRPCRLCRRPVIRGYYSEAIEKNVSIVFLGINEWCRIHHSVYSAIRKIEPIAGKAVYIVHFPFLIQKKFENLKMELEQLGWTKDNTLSIETGSSGCLLAKIAESKATNKLGFNPDETRLAREVTCGFIKREQALSVLQHPIPICKMKMKDILVQSGIIDG